ncbi:hypothetical protein H2248_003256 [Termitomyces sp. 'cryptogamus']|nr:hypothetical protein H2248_003256 [Termitomyces sp. 'cryptogamus']
MVKFTILAGGFAKFIATYLFDSEAGSLTLVKQNPTGENPSWIASHPQNSSILYAVNEISPVGSLQSFVVSSDGGLRLVDTVTSGGNGPTFTNPLSTGEVTAMNFGSPNCALVATDSNDPLRFSRTSPLVQFPAGNGPSNPHMSLEHKDEVFLPDLGGDKIWRLVRDGAPGNFKVQGQINVDAGSGPRHIAIHDNVLFIVSETVSTLTAMEIPPAPNGTALPPIANVSTIPPNFLDAKFAAAEILISTPTARFPDPLIYVSNRNLGPEFDPRGDTIAIFEIKRASVKTAMDRASAKKNRMLRHPHRGLRTSVTSASRLSLVAQVPTGLKQIRGMNLGPTISGGDKFLIAGANVDGGVVMFRRVNGGRNLIEVARNERITSRTSFVFV